MTAQVYIVDDDPVIRTLVEDYLSASGYDVKAYENGHAFLEAITKEASGESAMVLLDLQMPDMSGIDVLKEIKNNSNCARLPVVMLSANNSTEELTSKADVKADRYLAKPFNPKDILQIVKDYLR
ncbi:MAG: response regulator [Candidatus Dadabacteria bacterium]|nr:MAG: response regulator [Candidatus Dadabacteria bacterium]